MLKKVNILRQNVHIEWCFHLKNRIIVVNNSKISFIGLCDSALLFFFITRFRVSFVKNWLPYISRSSYVSFKRPTFRWTVNLTRGGAAFIAPSPPQTTRLECWQANNRPLAPSFHPPDPPHRKTKPPLSVPSKCERQPVKPPSEVAL